MSLTRINNDLCTISDRDERNQALYQYQLANIGNYRRGYSLNSQIYPTQTQGLEVDVDLESKLRGQYRVNNHCNLYGAGVQADIQRNAPLSGQLCVSNALAPEYTRMTKVARHVDIYESHRAKPMDWHFYSPPVEHPAFGMYRVDRWTDTVRSTKDQLEKENKQMLLRRNGGSQWCPGGGGGVQPLQYCLSDAPTYQQPLTTV